MCTILNGINGRIHLDFLAPVGFIADKTMWRVFIVKAPAASTGIIWHNTACDDVTLIPLCNMGADLTGKMQSVIFNQAGLAKNFIGSAATEHLDDVWHMLQYVDRVGGASPFTGELTIQKDGLARETTTTYSRSGMVDATFPKWYTLGVLRRGPVPSVGPFKAGCMGYHSLITGVDPSQGDMDDVWDSFNTGGGRSSTLRITEAIQSVVGAGTVRWAGGLDGTLPHVGLMPTYVNTTLELANW
jgi:hypothetical protein